MTQEQLTALLDLRDALSACFVRIKDHNTRVESGVGCGGADLWVTVDGVEYHVHVKPSAKHKAGAADD